jgi:protein SCO1/2
MIFGAFLRAFAFLTVLAAIAATGAGARASDALSGVVVGILPSSGEAIVRHEPFGGMPAMTMPFRIEPRADLARLHAGDRIEADATMGTSDEARLAHVRVVGTLGDSPRVLHDVPALHIGDPIPTTGFFDQNGRAFTFNDFRNQIVVLSFVYTRCRDARMCPLISSNFHLLQTKLAGLPVHLVEITLDPAFDTPTVLKNYGERFGVDADRWTLGTGTVDVVNDFAARFGIAVFADPGAGLIHSERTAIIDRNGGIVDLLDAAAWNPGDLVAEVRSLSDVPTNPIAWIDYQLSKASAALCGNNLAGYSGLLDLAIVLAIFAGACGILWFAARKIFIEEA